MNKALFLLFLLFQLFPFFALAEGFQKAEKPRVWKFPEDHGAHENFKTEWWYYTGHLFRSGKKPFQSHPDYGFQLTFFRSAKRKGEALGTQQLFLAHAALTDVRSGAFIHESRFAPQSLGIAGADNNSLHVWNHSWKAELFGHSHVLEFSFRQEKSNSSLRLILEPTGAPIIHGKNGVSQKAQCIGCASYYYSLPHLKTSGHLEIDGKRVAVTGLAWMDHEFMTNALTPEQTGWDWLGIMLPKNQSLMLFYLRDKKGAVHFGSGTLASEKESVHLEEGDFQIIPKDHWKSDASGGRYPIAWEVTVPEHNISLHFTAAVKNQEVLGKEPVNITYWEGITQEKSNKAHAYVEMTGYAEPLGEGAAP